MSAFSELVDRNRARRAAMTDPERNAEDEKERYTAMEQPDPVFKGMVWDWDENMSLCLCPTLEQAEFVAMAVNKLS